MNKIWDERVGASPGVRPVPNESCLPAKGRTPGDAPTQFRQPGHVSNIDSDATCQPDAEGHCITCSDEALTARVLRIDQEMGIASVAIEDALDEVDITLLDEVAEGDLLLVHGGVAIANVGRASPCGGPFSWRDCSSENGPPQGEARPTSGVASDA